MIIRNASKNSILADCVCVADNPVLRMVGLLDRAFMNECEALVIRPCMSIHTFFMQFDIDVVFVGYNNKVIAVYRDVKPFRILPMHLSQYVIEFKAGCGHVEKDDIIVIDE